MATITRGAKAGGGTNFNSGQTIDPSENNADFNTLYTEVNGNLDDANIETATIPGAKSLRFTEISAPSSPSSNDLLVYAADLSTVTRIYMKDSAGGVYLFVRADANNNIGIGTETFGTSAAGVLAQFSGTAPTTAPADTVQRWVSDRNGAGTAAEFIRTEDSGISERPLATLVQSYDGTERTTQATSTADLSSHTVNIPATDAFIVTGLVRKTTGHASVARLGIKINGTQIITDFAVTTANNAAEFGCFSFGIEQSAFGAGRDTNYTQGPRFMCTTGTSGGAITLYNENTYANQLPTAAITAIVITGHVANALNTLAVKHVTVYRIARS
jgi:hypothetical protein